ncbi:MAG: hypothetical protein HQM08_07440 [Candidatus Riflebacteria bacterium]|nr:hypothetical protein [Candidatus Riflebacteria bacterium]
MLKRQMTVLQLVIIMILFSNLSSVIASSDEAIPNYQELTLSTSNVACLISILDTEKNQLKSELEAKYSDKPQKITQDADLTVYNWAIGEAQRMQTSLGAGSGDLLLARDFLRIQRVHYSLLSDLGKGVANPSIGSKLQVAEHVIAGSLGLSVPNVIIPSQPIGNRLAQYESRKLFRSDGSGPVSVAELAGMSAFDISRLQPAFNSDVLKVIEPGDHFQAFIDEMTNLVRMQGGKLSRFDFSYARRILFFDELKNDATSPKITAKDRFGMKWKVKWGDEVHVGVALSRLFIDLGATYADQMFYSGPGETILVLAAPSDKDPNAVRTFDQLAKMLLESTFKFHAYRYLLSGQNICDGNGKVFGSGIVNEAMAETEGLDPKYVGAYFVKFKECQLSFYNPAIKRLGASAMSRLGALDDRVGRSSMILNCWIKNRDVKDENSRVGLLFNPESQQFDRLVEFQSDLGTALGNLVSGGELNSVERSMVLPMPTSLNFNLRPLFVPRPWKICTWADARWMVLRIAKLSREDIERAFMDCGWPAFVQKVAVERLVSRRNELARYFKLDADGIPLLPCNPDFNLIDPKTGDEPVHHGEINGSSRIVKYLEATIHPEGLARVLCRFFD